MLESFSMNASCQLRTLLTLLVAGQLGACALHPKPFPPMVGIPALAPADAYTGDLGAADQVRSSIRHTVDEAVQKLVEPLNDSHRAYPVVVATAADLNNLQVTRTFGMTVSEQVVGSLVYRGFRVREARLRSGLALRDDSGELLLSRDSRDIMLGEFQAVWVVVGTYSVAARSVLVQLRALNLSDGLIHSTASFELPLDADMRALLSDRPQTR
jgi:FlgO protein